MPIFFVEKNVGSFCSAKAFLISSTKNFSVFGYKVVKHFIEGYKVVKHFTRVDLLTSSLS